MFYNWEFERLMEMCAAGWGEMELHLHHRDDTSDGVRQKFREAVRTFRSYGALSQWPDGRPAFGFIHGNWALDNSIHYHGRNYCGVNNEIDILREEGCYADFTFPAWRHMAQPRQFNSIYYASDNPERPKSYDRGELAAVGKQNQSGLLIVQGPLVPHLTTGKRRLAMDDGDLAASRRYTPDRLDRWVNQGIHVQGRPDRVFIKLHSHGAPEANREAMLGTDMDALFTDAESRYNDGSRYRLHYVSAREMYNVIRATEASDNAIGDALRNYVLPPFAAARQSLPKMSHELLRAQ